MGTEPKMRTKRYLQNHVVYQRTEKILRNPLASPLCAYYVAGHSLLHGNMVGYNIMAHPFFSVSRTDTTATSAIIRLPSSQLPQASPPRTVLN